MFVCKTVHQYSKGEISDEDMAKLQAIAEDYRTVKNYVYSRYSGVGSLEKLYPGYTVQNEMTGSGLRGTLKMPSVYFYLAVFDALGDIKSQWTRTKNKVLELLGKNEGFSAEEKHYLRFLMKVTNAFSSVLKREPIALPREMEGKYRELAGKVDEEKLQNYLCRQVRKYHKKPYAAQGSGFSLSAKAYRYENHGISIASKEKRKRIFIPLTDNCQYKSQIYLKINPGEHSVQIHVPVNVEMKSHEDYQNRIGISLGMYTMLTVDNGNGYGEDLGKYQTEYADWMRAQTTSYHRNRDSNPGRKKYLAKKHRMTETMHSYINHELNRFLEEEKPGVIYLVKLPKSQGGGINRKINNSVALWQRGYIRGRLEQKCKEHGVEIVEVLGKDISNLCSKCGGMGSRKDSYFRCGSCGEELEEKVNTARNVLKRGMEGKVLKQSGGVKADGMNDNEMKDDEIKEINN